MEVHDGCSTLADLVDRHRIVAAGVDLGAEAITDGDQRDTWAGYADRVARLTGRRPLQSAG